MMKNYIRLPIDLPDSPNVLRAVQPATRTIYINRCAAAWAKVVVLIV